MAFTGKIRALLRRSRFLSVMLAVLFGAAQLLPAGLAMAASVDQSDYMVICTADGFKTVPLSQLGLDDLAGDASGSDVPGLQDCPVCLLICANGVSDVAPHVAVVWAPVRVETALVRDDRPVISRTVHLEGNLSPRAPPHLI